MNINNKFWNLQEILKLIESESHETRLARLRKIGILDENNKLTKHYTDRNDLSITEVMEEYLNKEDNE